MTQVEFNVSSFEPQFVSFRLRHEKYEMLSEPILASFVDETYIALIDLGDPVKYPITQKHIQPYSDDYQL